MLDIRKELEEFNRLLGGTDDDDVDSPYDQTPVEAEEVADTSYSSQPSPVAEVIESTPSDVDELVEEEMNAPLAENAEPEVEEEIEWEVPVDDDVEVELEVPGRLTEVDELPEEGLYAGEYGNDADELSDTSWGPDWYDDGGMDATGEADTSHDLEWYDAAADYLQGDDYTEVADDDLEFAEPTTEPEVPVWDSAYVPVYENAELAENGLVSGEDPGENFVESFLQSVAGDGDGSWEVTEHISPEDDQPSRSPGEAANDDQDDREAGTEAPVWSRIPMRERESDPDGSRGLQVPNFGHDPLPSTRDPESVDSLLLGARGALSDTQHLRPRASQGVTVHMVDRASEEDDDAGQPASARILPLFTFRAGMFEERIGAVVGAVAGVVILIAGVLFVPRLFSSDEPEELVSGLDAGAQDHLLSAAEPIDETATAALSIATFPPGARVYLNAELIGVTPFRDVAVQPGDYQLYVEKPDFAAIDTFLVLDRGAEFFFDLTEKQPLASGSRPEHQLLQVADDLSDPADGREVENRFETGSRSLNLADEPTLAQPAATSPGRIDESAGGLDVPTRSEGQESRERTRENSSRASRADVDGSVLQREARASGALVVTSEPMGAVVLLDGQVVGETPATLARINTGRVHLKLEKEGFVPYETDIAVMPSIQTPFHAALAPVNASLFINATPGGDLYIDGELVERGIRPGHMELVPVGRRNVRIVHPDYGEYTEVIDVTPDNKATVSVDMVSHGYEWSIENGDRLFNESRYQEAIVSYQRALSIRPGNPSLENKVALAAKAMAEATLPSPDNRSAPIDGIYSVTDTPPQLIGGLEALHSKVVYPEEAYNEGIQGRVYVQFVVDENGRAQNITIAKGLKGGCNEAAVDAVKKSRFKPATIGGVPVKARHTLFVNFTI